MRGARPATGGLLSLVLFGCALANGQHTVAPTDGMEISESMTLTPGSYSLSHGVSVTGSQVVLDMNGAELVGANWTGVGVTVAPGLRQVVVIGGTVRGYYYGMRLTDCAECVVEAMDLSANWLDPMAYAATPPWLDINVVPSDFGDRTNLGGGLWAENCSALSVSAVRSTGNENGMDLWNVSDSVFAGNNCSHNVGWGLHFWKSVRNTIAGNVADYCTRVGPNQWYTCDTAGLLLNCQCDNNTVTDNSFRHGGDGIFMSGFPRNGENECCPSNGNLVVANDCSFSPNNAIESTFAKDNVFAQNVLNGSNYGMWLGYSRRNVVAANVIGHSQTAGIAIEHGQENELVNNWVEDGLVYGLLVYTDLQVHYPLTTYQCLDIPNQEYSANYTVTGNYLVRNANAMRFANTTQALFANNLVDWNSATSGVADTGLNTGNAWNVATALSGPNIVDGPMIGGNYWSQYVVPPNCTVVKWRTRK